ncbi:MAG: 2-hydroxyacid dehydrogenase, partial [Burkholderiales bacterium]
MKPRVLVTRKVFPEVLEALRSAWEVVANEGETAWSAEELRAHAAQCDALYVVAGDRIDEGLLAVCPRLRIVATGSVGFNHIDVAACTARGIAVTNTPDVLNEATADLGWALLMAAARRVCESEHWLRAGQWNRWSWDQFLGADVHGTTLGIVGMGRIGSAIARRARGFSMRILYANRSPSAHEAELGATRVSLDDLLRQSDHVMLVLPYNPQTHHLICERELGLM